MDIKEMFALARCLGYSDSFTNFKQQFDEALKETENVQPGSPDSLLTLETLTF